MNVVEFSPITCIHRESSDPIVVPFVNTSSYYLTYYIAIIVFLLYRTQYLGVTDDKDEAGKLLLLSAWYVI